MQGRRASIVDQLALWYFVSLFILVFSATAYLYWSLAGALRHETASILLDRIQAVEALLKRSDDPLGSASRRIETEWPLRHFEQVFIAVTDGRGHLLIRTPNTPEEVIDQVYPAGPESTPGEKSPAPRRISLGSGHAYVTLTAAVIGQSTPTDPGGVYRILGAVDLTRQEDVLSGYRNRLFAVLLAALLVSALLARKLATAGFGPVRSIIEAARRVNSSSLHERIDEDELPIELLTLGGTINAMLNRLEESFDRLSRFSADIAHELRTPLNNIQGEVEVVLGKERPAQEYAETLHSCLEECKRLYKIIDGLLFVAKAENPRTQIKRVTLNLRTVLAKIIEFYEATAAEEGVEVRLEADESLTLEADQTLFQQAIANLLSNAINHTPRGGAIAVSARVRGETVEITVADNGAGIPEEDLKKVFDRFYRADSARSATKLGGFGLGLTIVRSILSLHHGDIRIESGVGKGTSVTLVFPR